MMYCTVLYCTDLRGREIPRRLERLASLVGLAAEAR